MKRAKDLDLKIVYELMKNSKISDRKLASKLKVSQPTITRRRAKIERELIDGYTAIPKWEKLGYKIFTILLFSGKVTYPIIEYMDKMGKARDWINKQSNIIMFSHGRGIESNGVILSFHKNYGSYDEFLQELRIKLGDLVTGIQSFIVNLSAEERLKPLHLKYLVEAE